jgi:hypothetical protein
MDNKVSYEGDIDAMLKDSIRRHATITITERIGTPEWATLTNSLAYRAEDWVEITAGDARLTEEIVEIREYWGAADEDGGDWRIHVYGTRPEQALAEGEE